MNLPNQNQSPSVIRNSGFANKTAGGAAVFPAKKVVAEETQTICEECCVIYAGARVCGPCKCIQIKRKVVVISS